MFGLGDQLKNLRKEDRRKFPDLFVSYRLAVPAGRGGKYSSIVCRRC
jgi:hypothetical protein